MKLAVLTSHPIQYQAPIFRLLVREEGVDLKVYFKKHSGVKSYEDKEFGKRLKWDIPLLEGYSSKFLINKFTIFNDLRREGFDAVLVYGWNSLLNQLVVLYALFSGIKILLHGENPLNQEILKPSWKRWVKKVIFGKTFFKLVDGFLYIGEENRKFYKFYGVPDEKLFFTPYAVDNDRFQKSAKELKPKRDELRRKLGIKKDDAVILFVGKLIPKKRPMDLLKAFTVMRNTRMSANTANNNADDKIVERELSYKLNGIFFEIHNELGRFARERQYADALEAKLKEQDIKYRREFAVPVVGRKSNIADFIIEDRVLVEIKRKPTNTGDDYRQVKRYLESANFKLGILVNFGLEYLKPKRILNSKFDRKEKHSPNSHSFADSHYATHLVFVGSGKLENDLEAYAKSIGFKEKHSPNSHSFADSHYAIHFVGFKNQTELPEYYAMADIFVLPSGMGETWGLVINEAMNFGLPIIVSDIPGAGFDLARSGENGYVFPLGDVEELTKIIRGLVKDKEKREKFSERSFEIVQSYSYRKDIEGILRALEYAGNKR